MGNTKLPIQQVQGVISPRRSYSEQEADHSTQSN